jgi:hypothetical protein
MERYERAPRRAQGSLGSGIRSWSALGAIALAIAATAPAGATPLSVGGAGSPAFFVDPIYFNGFDQFGLVGPGTGGADYFAVSPIPFLTVSSGGGAAIDLSQVLQEPVYQHPQNPADSQNPGTNGGVPTSPTAAVPFVADSFWTFTNTTAAPLEDVLLLFTKATGATEYPPVNVALDGFLYSVLQYESQTAGTLYFGVLPLGDIGPGEQTTVRVRYIVSDPLLFQNDDYVIPPLGLAAIAKGSYVPEPATGVLVMAGLALLRLRARRVCA